jgi:hypothetical protein
MTVLIFLTYLQFRFVSLCCVHVAEVSAVLLSYGSMSVIERHFFSQNLLNIHHIANCVT